MNDVTSHELGVERKGLATKTRNKPVGSTWPELFEANVERKPEGIAVVCKDTHLTYWELNGRANRLAHLLVQRGIGPEDILAVAMPRSLDFIVTLLGIARAGAAYLALDPEYPFARLKLILEDASPTRVLTTIEIAQKLPGTGTHILLDDARILHDLTRSPTTDVGNRERNRPLLPDHPVHVMYTSGSTGDPKGVIVCHAGVASLLKSLDQLVIEAASRVLQFAPSIFDATFFELAMSLGSGAIFVLWPDADRAGDALARQIQKYGITHVTLPPSVLASLSQSAELELKTLVIAGESCPAHLVESWSNRVRMINAYGPTETTVCATMSSPLAGREVPPIGKPIWNTRVYVLGGNMQVVPVGVPGELYIAGAGLARGYLNRPGLTAEGCGGPVRQAPERGCTGPGIW